jgi:arylformamidase
MAKNYGFLGGGPFGKWHECCHERTFAPAINVDGIVAEIKCALNWIVDYASEFRASRYGVYVPGHSAGGPLTAMVMEETGVKGAMSISGIFDLEPIRLGCLNDKIKMDEAEARRNSPILFCRQETYHSCECGQQ